MSKDFILLSLDVDLQICESERDIAAILGERMSPAEKMEGQHSNLK